MLHDVCAIISMYITKHLSILYQTTVSMTGPACHQEPSSVVKQSAYRGHLATSKRPGGCCFGGREGCIGVYMQQTNLCIYIYISTYIYIYFFEHMKFVWKHVFQIMKANTFQRKRTCASYWFIHFNISFWTYRWSSSSIFKMSIKILKVKDWAKFQTSSLWIHWNHQRDCRNTTCFRNKTPLWVGMSES